MRSNDDEVTIEWRWGSFGGPSIVFGVVADARDVGWYYVHAHQIEPCTYTTGSGPVPVDDTGQLLKAIGEIQSWAL